MSCTSYSGFQKFVDRRNIMSCTFYSGSQEFVGKRNVLCTSYSGSQEFVDKTGEQNVVYIDPLGAVVIGAYILVSWWQTGVG